MSEFQGDLAPNITPQAQWAWSVPVLSGSTGTPNILGYPPGGINQPTKSGVMPADLQNFIGVPLVFYGNPIQPIPPSTVLQWIRQAEDWIERETSILLCQTWVAAPPLVQPGNAQTQGVIPANQQYMIQGVDYDLGEAPYDFWFPRAEDSAWMAYTLRYRPVQMINATSGNYSAIQRQDYMYPLLNEFFRVPPQWMVIDPDFGYVRLVPTTNVQMLPLFALYLGFLAFTDSLPGGLSFQYTAGLLPQDLQTRYSFIPQLVLAQAAITALSIIQGTINTGFSAFEIQMDSVKQSSKFNEKGPYAGLISTFTKMRDDLMATAKSKVSGPMLTFL